MRTKVKKLTSVILAAVMMLGILDNRTAHRKCGNLRRL